MKALVLTLFFVTSSAFATIVPTKNVTVATNFEFKTGTETIKQSGTMIVDPTQAKWTTMVPPKDGVALLGRVEKLEGKVATMEFMIVDTNNKREALQSNPKLVTKLGQQGVIAQGPTGEEPTMKIAVTVEKTR